MYVKIIYIYIGFLYDKKLNSILQHELRIVCVHPNSKVKHHVLEIEY